MGTNNIPAAVDSTIIPADHHNKIRTALIGDVVPRNASANASDAAGSIGTSAFRWLQGYIKTLFIGAVGDNISLSASGGSLIISVGGNESAKFPSTNRFLPSGMTVGFAGSGDIGTEWLLCDGREINRTTFANLFTAIGTTHGEGNATTTFNIPDYRGRFLRGTDDMGTVAGAGARDPNAATRTAMGVNGNTGNNVGSVQSEEMKAHTHIVGFGANYPNGTLLSGPGDRGGDGATNNTSSVGGSETRPINAYTNYIIKT